MLPTGYRYFIYNVAVKNLMMPINNRNVNCLYFLFNKSIRFIGMYRLEKYRAAHSEVMFSDEVETPMNVPARIRFQR